MIQLLDSFIVKNELQFLQLLSQDARLNTLELTNVASNDFSVINDVCVLCTIVNEQEVIIIQIIILLAGIGTDHHVESDVIRIEFIIFEVVQFNLGIMHPLLCLLEFTVVNCL